LWIFLEWLALRHHWSFMEAESIESLTPPCVFFFFGKQKIGPGKKKKLKKKFFRFGGGGGKRGGKKVLLLAALVVALKAVFLPTMHPPWRAISRALADP